MPVYSPINGRAYFQIDPGGGHGVVIISDDQYDYLDATAQFKVILWHFCDSLKEPQYRSPIEQYFSGTQVKIGDLVGYADSTGASTGDHLHFGLKPVAVGEAQNTWYNIEQNNGYMGAINPFPYFDPALNLPPITPQHVPTVYPPNIQAVLDKSTSIQFNDKFLYWLRVFKVIK